MNLYILSTVVVRIAGNISILERGYTLRAVIKSITCSHRKRKDSINSKALAGSIGQEWGIRLTAA